MNGVRVSEWVIVGGHGAARIIEGGDPNNVNHRVAFIEKTPRVRIRSAFLGRNQWEDFLNWADGPKGNGAFDENSRTWCDTALKLFGYKLP